MDFLVRELPGLLADARAALGGFVGADADDLAFVPNATAGVNAVVRSLAFSPGDEILTTDHAYAACRKTLDYVASRTGARVVAATVPFPLRGEEDVVSRRSLGRHAADAPRDAGPRHEPDGARLSDRAARRGALGARRGHARGRRARARDGAARPERLGAAYYTANAHKWLCAPKGAAFLHVRKDRQKGLHPVAISHGYAGGEPRFRDEFDWTGTDRPDAALCIPDCIAYLGGLVCRAAGRR